MATNWVITNKRSQFPGPEPRVRVIGRAMLPLWAPGENPSLLVPASGGSRRPGRCLSSPGHRLCLWLITPPPRLSLIGTAVIGFRVQNDSKILHLITSAKTLFPNRVTQVLGVRTWTDQPLQVASLSGTLAMCSLYQCPFKEQLHTCMCTCMTESLMRGEKARSPSAPCPSCTRAASHPDSVPHPLPTHTPATATQGHTCSAPPPALSCIRPQWFSESGGGGFWAVCPSWLFTGRVTHTL